MASQPLLATSQIDPLFCALRSLPFFLLSPDGTIQLMDMETSQSTELINLNPAGYTTVSHSATDQDLAPGKQQ
jgi:hypothetical protein